MRSLKDKLAWITGAGTGIGEGSANALARLGMKVVLSGRRREMLEAVAEGIDGEVVVEPLDVADREAVIDVAARVLAQHGPIDTLVLSAGINVCLLYTSPSPRD